MATKPLDDKEFEELLMGDPSTPPPSPTTTNTPVRTVTQDNFDKCVTILYSTHCFSLTHSMLLAYLLLTH
jgi:hypothetical protein